MPSISSAGIGSGLDINSLVTQLVAAERAPTQTRIATARSETNLKLSALGAFKGALSGVLGKLDALLDGGALSTLSAKSSSDTHFTATAASDAVAGRYDIEVVSLAMSTKSVSDVFSGGATSVLGNGDVTIDVGGTAFTVTLADGANTLADLRDGINAASDNSGVSATLINADGGTRLLLSATEPGAQAITVTSGLITTSELQAGTDAHVRVDGFDVHADGNTLTDAIDGVTLNLLDAEPGTTFSLDIAVDTQAGSKAINDFVSAYNNALKSIGEMTAFDASAGSGGPLLGDATVRSALQGMRNVLGSVVGGGTLEHLSQIGITTMTDGSLSVDSAKLGEALAEDRSGVMALFSGEQGYATRLKTLLEGVTGEDGSVETRLDTLNLKLETLNDQQDRLDLRMDQRESFYRARFGALDTLLAQLQTTSSFLTQQLEALASLSNSGNS